MNEKVSCKLCELHTGANRKAVCLKGSGGDDPRLMLFLDFPNMVEDKRAKGCVSDSVEWLKWCFRRMSIDRKYLYIDYVLKCHVGRITKKKFGTKANRQQYYEACSVYRIATLQQIKPKAIVAMGSKACEAFLGGDKLKDWEGTTWIADEPFVRDFCDKIWVTYAPAYALKSPAESVTIFRTLWHAAISAGLQPKIDKTVIPYDYGF